MKKHLVSIATLVVIAGLALGAVAIWQARRAGTPSAAPATAAAKQPEGPEGIVHFSDAQIRQFGVGTDVAGQGRLRIEVVLPGEVALNADRVAHVVPRVSGVVREVRKNLGDTVLRGEIMAVLESRELADSTAALLAARERVNLAQSNFAREEQLWQKKISPEQDYIQAKNALAEAGIELRTTEQKLRALGFSEQYIAKLPDRGGQAAILYEMAAPFDATIIEKHISLGEVLKEESSAFMIADLSSVWVNLDVHQKDLPLIQVGQTAAIGVGNMAPSVQGRISFLEPMAEETNRTIHARVVIPNAGGKWRPGLFVTGRIAVDDAQIPVLVPNEALVMIGGKTCLFLKEGDRFRLQPVLTGRTNGASTEITEGLAPGQIYVAKGAFTLKSELGKPEQEK
ncbi:MAG: efflux RND transporter periplasmic adaptor subunit [Acidobacteriia bacterium]|nr:efflux RND transporter periplasmic adaptor subunit [Terriglobia bacterium]